METLEYHVRRETGNFVLVEIISLDLKSRISELEKQNGLKFSHITFHNHCMKVNFK